MENLRGKGLSFARRIYRPRIIGLGIGSLCVLAALYPLAMPGWIWALWLLNALYRQVRRRNGIGQGDFKLLAALGAWLGWTILPLLVCLAAMFGLGMALARGRRNRRAWRTPQPFGIALAAAGWLLLLLDAGQNAPALFG